MNLFKCRRVDRLWLNILVRYLLIVYLVDILMILLVDGLVDMMILLKLLIVRVLVIRFILKLLKVIRMLLNRLMFRLMNMWLVLILLINGGIIC